ncbi:5-methyltetrahydropteroyltriglutamate--homocysteine S-methyltransferase [Pseudokineococcus basanitobsidens]|uniref:5-methyltetrahydropteroyltriglutamate--homocysteine S-methyltransferase n=1 Tax=Pseudokineococcus basanitobsidens TaxID=1926649 RepID=A0ABU8RMJ0_9ACTN
MTQHATTATDGSDGPDVAHHPTATLSGYPRQGRDRELKRALEAHWAGRLDAAGLLDVVGQVQDQRFGAMAAAGVTEVPAGDFSLYDHVLDTAVLLGLLPARCTAPGLDPATPAGRLGRYFLAARGRDADGHETQALEMTKWFDTNYHHLVPELGPTSEPAPDAADLLEQVRAARRHGLEPRPVVVGPVTFLRCSKAADDAPAGWTPDALLPRLLPVYAELLAVLADEGCAWVELDESVLVTGADDGLAALARTAHAHLAGLSHRPRLLVAGHYERLGDAATLLLDAGVDGLAVDLAGASRAEVEELAALPGLAGRRLVAGVVDGRGVWRRDLSEALDHLEVLARSGARVDVAPSCSLLHVPVDVSREDTLDPDVRSWLAFADQKLEEVVVLARGLAQGRDAVAAELGVSDAVRASRLASARTRTPAVRERGDAVTPGDLRRPAPADERRALQAAALRLPPLPTTTIGSFPQTPEIRRARAAHRAGRLDDAGYEAAMEGEVRRVVAEQEEAGVDVLVHGEPERDDMVRYFADRLEGFVTPVHGWVQSYGSRCVRPPVVVGDVRRPGPMTVRWTRFAQRLTDAPVKGMLTGPVTILAWSFPRDDEPRSLSARQVALALRDEVADLEAAGTRVVQVDEPGLRELLPLRASGRQEYLAWAVDAFRLATGGAAATTQVHTHMCYAEFGDVMAAIDALDADVISLEAARSRMEVLDELADEGYDRAVGPGVWDIHSPVVPTADEVSDHLARALERLPADRLWVNPDCGLKTRTPEEVSAGLTALVAGAARARQALAGRDGGTTPR